MPPTITDALVVDASRQNDVGKPGGFVWSRARPGCVFWVGIPDRSEPFVTMDQESIKAWALANGWTMVAGAPSLTKPSAPKEAIVRIVFKATVVHVEVKKPAGKWEKISGESYGKIELDDETGMPHGLGFERIPSFSSLMRDNKDRQVFANMK